MYVELKYSGGVASVIYAGSCFRHNSVLGVRAQFEQTDRADRKCCMSLVT